MKVTFCAHDRFNYYAGGPNVWLRRLLPELRLRGIQPRVLFFTSSPAEECPTVSLLRQQGFDCPAIFWPKYTEERLSWILEKIAQEPPEIFIPNLDVSACYAGRWIRKAGIPTVGMLRSDSSFYHGLLSEFVFGKKAYRFSSVVCVSKFLEQIILERHPTTGILVRRIPSGVPIPQRVAQFPSGYFRMVYVGRFVEEQKRISEITRAFCRATREVPGTEAVLYGDGPARPAVEKILCTEGKGLPITLAGLVDNDRIQEHLLKCHILVLLSDYEGLPISLMEAMACGVVPVCLRIRSGIPEVVEDGVTGLLVGDRGDEFISSIRKLRYDLGLWRKLSQAARFKIETEYSNELCAARWEELLRELFPSPYTRQPLRVPRRLTLPPIHHDLACEDIRKPKTYMLLIQGLRRLAGRIKRRLFGE